MVVILYDSELHKTFFYSKISNELEFYILGVELDNLRRKVRLQLNCLLLKRTAY